MDENAWEKQKRVRREEFLSSCLNTKWQKTPPYFKISWLRSRFLICSSLFCLMQCWLQLMIQRVSRCLSPSERLHDVRSAHARHLPYLTASYSKQQLSHTLNAAKAKFTYPNFLSPLKHIRTELVLEKSISQSLKCNLSKCLDTTKSMWEFINCVETGSKHVGDFSVKQYDVFKVYSLIARHQCVSSRAADSTVPL